MQPLIKITTEPIQIMRISHNARLVSADAVDMERRKAIARQMTMHRTSGQGSASMESLAKINRTFSTRANTVPAAQQKQNDTFQQLASRQYQAMTNAVPQVSVPAYTPQSYSVSSADFSHAEHIAAASTSTAAAAAQATLASASSKNQNVAANGSSSYAVQRGAFEMRIAKGELTYLPPMTMTIVTQRPSVHVEYLGGYNFFPPPSSNTSFNLFT